MPNESLPLVAGTEMTIRELFAIIQERERLSMLRFDSLEKAMTAAQVSHQLAIDKATLATEKRFDSVNEFRGALSDQARGFLLRNEYLAQHQVLIDQITITSERLTKLESRLSAQKEGLSLTGSVIMGVVSGTATLISIATLLFNVIRVIH